MSDEPLFASLDDTDPAMVAALSEAKRTLPQFMDAVSIGRFSSAICLVKVPFLDQGDIEEPAIVRTAEVASGNPTGQTCHLWLAVDSALEDLLFCSVGEAPAALRLTAGDSFVVSIELIEDWMINDAGVTYGGFSMRVIRSRLPQDQQRRFDEHTGINEFKKLAP